MHIWHQLIFVLHLIHAIHSEGKLSKMYMGLYQVINKPCQWQKQGLLHDILCFHYYDLTLIYNWLNLTSV